MGALLMQRRGMEMRAITRVGGATAAAAAAAFRWTAWVGSGVADAVGDAEGESLIDAMALRFVDAMWAGERPSPAAGMLASSRRMATEKTARDPRLMDLCSQPLRESQSSGEGATRDGSLACDVSYAAAEPGRHRPSRPGPAGRAPARGGSGHPRAGPLPAGRRPPPASWCCESSW